MSLDINTKQSGTRTGSSPDLKKHTPMLYQLPRINGVQRAHELATKIIGSKTINRSGAAVIEEIEYLLNENAQKENQK